MALSNQLAQYEDCIKLYDLAADNPKGARAQFETVEEAKYFRLRMHHARVLERRESCRLYERNDPRYNKSEHDKFVCQVREDTEGMWWLYVVPVASHIIAMEPITEEG